MCRSGHRRESRALAKQNLDQAMGLMCGAQVSQGWDLLAQESPSQAPSMHPGPENGGSGSCPEQASVAKTLESPAAHSASRQVLASLDLLSCGGGLQGQGRKHRGRRQH